MGYETKLMIGVTYQGLKEGNANFFKEIASIDLCKSHIPGTFFDESDKSEEIYFYGTNGDTRITEDKYGSMLYAIDPKKVLKFIKSKNADGYRRYNTAIPLLKSLIKDFKGESLKCVLYGH